MANKNRNPEIETLRGFACILLVAYHVIGATPSIGLKISDGFLREMNDDLAYIRMPLFTFLSGFVYALRPYAGDWRVYVKGKATRLLVPMLFVGTLFALLQAFVPGVNSPVTNWHLLHIVPVGHFWFLEALMWIFLLMIPLEATGSLSRSRGVLLVMLIASLISLSGASFRYLGVDGAIYLMPFFLLGLYLSRFGYSTPRPIGVFLICIVAALVFFMNTDAEVLRRSLFALSVGALACIGLLATRVTCRSVAAIGCYSYSIYLHHVFFTAASRIVLYRMGVNDVWLLLFFGVLFGVSGPLVLEALLGRYRLARTLLFGKTA